MARQEDFMRQLRATFGVEAAEHLQSIASGLDQIEKSQIDTPDDPAARAPFVESVFRAAHSLKGASRAVDFGEIETICDSLENLFSSWKRGKAAPTRETTGTPMTYATADGRQFVVVATGRGPEATLVAFALP